MKWCPAVPLPSTVCIHCLLRFLRQTGPSTSLLERVLAACTRIGNCGRSIASQRSRSNCGRAQEFPQDCSQFSLWARPNGCGEDTRKGEKSRQLRFSDLARSDFRISAPMRTYSRPSTERETLPLQPQDANVGSVVETPGFVLWGLHTCCDLIFGPR